MLGIYNISLPFNPVSAYNFLCIWDLYCDLPEPMENWRHWKRIVIVKLPDGTFQKQQWKKKKKTQKTTQGPRQMWFLADTSLRLLKVSPEIINPQRCVQGTVNKSR